MNLVGVCNTSRDVFPAPDGTISAIAAVRAIDRDRGADVLNPQYEVVEELSGDEAGYLVCEIDDAIEVDGDRDTLAEAIAGASYTCVRARYSL
ncbi:hypothetical protein IVB38_12605 [Bradyrhizobium sp. 38]|uniref:hypothetical protein n=1 Tax=unclassified Bradyrhizobium TaxID=2631580 RepID=UPI001FFB2B21|nr:MULTISPECIES: hypothetical protein [unclassified Bradyrhizobium]MCK1336839.1 hypothetical protein [Bradyrhizobium sp. 38]MCK1776859.1 hypothetical protein [Bradyrhizobium sp. 132]